MPSLKTKTLITYLKQFQSGAIAFSGGVDSTLLLYFCREAWDSSPLALSFFSPLLLEEERERIERLAKDMGVRLLRLKTMEYRDKRFRMNSPARCYYCKKSRFKQVRPILKEKGIRFLLDGTNADDLKTYRPGIRASRESHVISPLSQLGWTKAEIRKVSRSLGLPTWDQPSSPCLATRIAYGQPITLPLLKRLALGETLLFEMGFKECRLRVHQSLTRIEVPQKDFKIFLDQEKRENLIRRLSKLGFSYITLDLKGLRSGSMDEFLKKGSKG